MLTPAELRELTRAKVLLENPGLTARLAGHNFWFLTKTAAKLVWEAEFRPGDVLVFGSETRGLPAAVLGEQPHRNLRLPMREPVRSLNLASAATAVVYEALRQFGNPL